jgi:succinyl-diaminopimelate desuccinylase
MVNRGESTEVFRKIESSRDEMVRFLCDLIKIPAVAPSSGGSGEWDKVKFIEERARALGFSDIERYDANDRETPSGARPNIVVWLKGKSEDKGNGKGGTGDNDEPRLLVLTHTDVVPPGDMNAWDSDPFSPVVKDGKILGRGAEDNGQSLTAALFAARSLMDLGIQPDRDIGLVMVADEEVGNRNGTIHLMKDGLFRKNDLILVPDHGEPDGRLVDVSEKSIAWVKVTTKGEQSHSSRPDRGNNALRAAMMFGTMADRALHERFAQEDPLFDHPSSSFEPTKKEPNVPNVNTIPGEDVFYLDCRVLPIYKLSDVMAEMRSVADIVEKKTGTKITLEPVLRQESAPRTPEDAPIVKMLLEAIATVRKNNPYAGGISANTVASILRRAGHHAAVWETVENSAHSPNEYAVIDNMVNDCKVFGALFAGRI